MRVTKNLNSFKIILVFFISLFFSHPTITEGKSKFVISSSSEQLKEETQNILNTAYQRISQTLQDSLTYITTVYIADSEAEFQSKISTTFPDWGIGCAIPDRHLIVVKSPIEFRYGKSLKQVLEHELAHIFLETKVKGKRIPRWLNEGFAMMQSHEWTLGQDVVVARAVLTNSVFPLSKIERLNRFNQNQADLAYTLSFLAASYLFREYGEEGFIDITELFSQGESWDEVFLEGTGSDYIDFQMEFHNYIKNRYQWISLLGDTYFFWLGLAFLIILIYLLKKRYTKKILRKWEEEEKSQANEKEAD
jgi:hypothetical protein